MAANIGNTTCTPVYLTSVKTLNAAFEMFHFPHMLGQSHPWKYDDTIQMCVEPANMARIKQTQPKATQHTSTNSTKNDRG